MNIMDTTTLDQYPPSTSGASAGGICRNFIWGICSYGTQCIYRHELEYNTMKDVLKFCRDYQNTGCNRTGCTYLHTSRKEQNLFLTERKIPRVLVDRYTHILSASAPAPPVSENLPPQSHHMYKNISPSPPATMGAGVPHSPMMHSSAQGSMLGPISGPIQGPVPGPMQGSIPCSSQGPIPCPMPVPAPIPVVGMLRMAAPPHSFPFTHPQLSLHNNAVPPPMLPPMFDPSQPPPSTRQATSRRLLKRGADNCEAGPSKLRKVEPTEAPCTSCVQRHKRADVLSNQARDLERQTDRARRALKDQMDAFEKKLQFLSSILEPDMYRQAIEFIHNGSPSPISLRSEVYNPSLMSSPMTASLNTTNDLLHQLLERFQGNNTSGFMESMSSAAADDVGLMPILSRARPNNDYGSSDILSTVLPVLLRNDRESARPAGAAPSPAGESELSRPSGSGNGFSRFLGGGASPHARPLFDAGLLTAATARPSREAGAPAGLLTGASARPFHDAGAPASLLTSASLRPYADGSAAGASAPLPYADAAPAALPYGEAGPPPHTHFVPNIMPMPNPPYRGAAMNQPPRSPMPAPNNPCFMGDRYPNPPYQ